jgi:hypothetical protein
LNFEKVEVSNERLADVLNTSDNLPVLDDFKRDILFSVYRAPCVIANEVSPAVLNYATGFLNDCDVYLFYSFEYLTDHFIADVKAHAHNISEVPEELNRFVWRTILGITGLDYPVEELGDLDFDSDFAKVNLTKYKWYDYWLDEDRWFGTIVLYPEHQTFVIFILPKVNDWNAFDWQ